MTKIPPNFYQSAEDRALEREEKEAYQAKKRPSAFAKALGEALLAGLDPKAQVDTEAINASVPPESAEL